MQVGGLFLPPPPRWCRLASDQLRARQRQDPALSDERCEIEIQTLWNNGFSPEAADAWNRDYRPVLHAQLPELEISPVTLESFTIWLQSWPFKC